MEINEIRCPNVLDYKQGDGGLTWRELREIIDAIPDEHLDKVAKARIEVDETSTVVSFYLQKRGDKTLYPMYEDYDEKAIGDPDWDDDYGWYHYLGYAFNYFALPTEVPLHPQMFVPCLPFFPPEIPLLILEG